MLLGARTSTSRTERAARILVGGSFPLKLLSLLPHAVRTGTSAFPALTDLVQLLNEFLGKAEPRFLNWDASLDRRLVNLSLEAMNRATRQFQLRVIVRGERCIALRFERLNP